MTLKTRFVLALMAAACVMPSAVIAGNEAPKGDKEIAKKAVEELEIPGGVNMRRSDLKLPTTGFEGTTISWTSSDPSYIDNSGKIIRRGAKGSGGHDVTLTATAKKNKAKASKKFKVKLAEGDDYDSYLFVYFPSNENENLYYAISEDGYNFTPLNRGEMVMASDTVAVKKGIRDPHILRGPDGKFYMVATDMQCREGWSSNRGIVMYTSDDLVNWKHSTVHFPDRFKEWVNVKRVWAPEVIWDPDYLNTDGSKGRYLIFFSLLTDDGKCDYDKIYYCYANDDFTDLMTDPVYFYDRGSATIDGDIVYDDRTGLYHMVYKNEGNGSICQVTATRLTPEPGQPAGSQWGNPSDPLQQTNVSVEGAGMYRLINSDSYILMYDCYGNGYYQFCESDDLDNFKLIAQTETKGAFTPRHGTVIPITKAERERLLKVFPIE